MKLTHKQKLYSLITLTLLLLIGLGLTFYYLHQTDQVLAKKRELKNQLGKDLAALDQLIEVKKTYSQDLGIIAQSLPASYRDVALYTQNLEQLASKSNQVLETKIDAQTKPDKSGLNSLTYSITTTGSFLEFNELISRIASLPFHTKIDSINLTNAEGQSTTTTYRLYLLGDVSANPQVIPHLDIPTIKALSSALAARNEKGGE